MKVKVAVAMRPGTASGSTMCSTARGRLAPSVSAASSSSSGMLWKKLRSSHSANGRHSALYASTRPVCVFVRPSARIST
jgi:hypothetical protein